MTPDERNALKKLLLSLVPSDGQRVSNAWLLNRFVDLNEIQSLSVEERRALYWNLREELIDEGELEKGRGQGGSIRRTAAIQTESDIPEVVHEAHATPEETVSAVPETAPKEIDLYDPFIQALKDGYISEYKVPKDFLLVKTANTGSKNTGGKWTRPDIALLAVHRYPFLPNKSLEVTTFEIKKSLDDALQGVFESLAHSAFAHRTYLAVKVEEQIPREQADNWTRVREECDRLAIGLIKFSNAREYETFEFISEASPNEPDLYKVNEFISRQIPERDQETIREWVR